MFVFPRTKTPIPPELRTLLALCCIVGVLLAPRLLQRPSATPPAAVSGPLPLRAAPDAATKNAGAKEKATEDAVKDAAPQPTEPDGILNSIWSDGRGVVWVGGSAGRAWRSADYGRTFARVAVPVREALVGVTGRPGGAVVVATEHAVYRSRDNGSSWTLAARLERGDSEAEPALKGLYSDGTTLWASTAGGDDREPGVYTMALGGRHLSRLPDRYDEIRAVLGRRGAVLVLNVVYNCHSGDYLAVDRLDEGHRKFRPVGKGADDFAGSAEDARSAYMTPGGDLYLLAGWIGDPSLQVLLRRRAGASDFQRAPLVAHSLWASDDGEVFITTPRGAVRRSTDHGRSFGQAIALP